MHIGVIAMTGMTKNRAELLRLFFTNPEESFYLQEIGRVIGKKPGVFHRTINNMEKEGVLVSERRANARYFRVCKEYPLYAELKSMVFKTIGIIGSVKDVLKRMGGIEYAFVYGSYAKGKDNHLSDIDLVIVGACDEDMLIKECDKLEELLKREINYKLYTVSEFKKNVKEMEPFLLNILNEKKLMLIGEEDGFQPHAKTAPRFYL
jgi:predicted nucleotidyltransferase